MSENSSKYSVQVTYKNDTLISYSNTIEGLRAPPIPTSDMADTVSVENVPIGIDLGTTFSVVAKAIIGNCETMLNERSRPTTPSYVSFTNDGITIGDTAKDNAASNAENTIFEFKRLIGRTYEEIVAKDKNFIDNAPFKIVNHRGKPRFDVVFGGETFKLDPIEISALFLYKMKKTLETKAKDISIQDVVITVPANFTNTQRLATSTAGKLAGLPVIHIINEHTAAIHLPNIRVCSCCTRKDPNEN